ncbi:AI-2E family transporter [Thermaerobacter sp. PB12/4term]|uniref:AI-2E family transporter n=1 Tax=Thermaerobacter sp. PB12/4term TaxID=2293838 RepID=UPI000E3288B9|nr:AI-2E family transporter [Thermaerobacter sp. PB12/4term]QIA26270.1 AI-2E family transporter [Thermaerobacter sp. PB12/4term]
MATEPPKQPALPPAGAPGPAGPAWSTLVGLLNILAGAGVLWLVWWVLSHFGRTLALLGLAGVLAFLLEPAVSFLERGMRSRALAALLLYLAFVALLALGVVYLAGPIKEQAQELFWSVPRYRQQVAEAVPILQNYMELLREFLARYGVSVEPQDLAGQFLQRVAGSTNRILAGVTALVTGIGTTLANAVLVLVISIYLVVDGSGLNRQMLGYLPARYRRPVRRAQSVALRVFGGYLRGQLLLGLIIGLVVGIGMSLLGIPYPALLGVIAGVMELLPIVGAVLGAIPAILVALFQPWPAVLYVTLFFIVVQQVEGNLLVPRITGQAVGLHPLATLLALLAGYEVAGVLGAILAVPVAAVAQALLREFNPPDPDPGEPGGGGNRGKPRRPSRAPRPVGAQAPAPPGDAEDPGREANEPAGAGSPGPLPPERREQEPAREGQDPPPPARGPRVVITRRPA